MALEFELDDLDSVDESIKGFYAQHENGKFRLDVSGIDPADELKGALVKEREARKLANERIGQFESERKAAQDAADLAQREALQTAGKWEELYKLEQEQKQKALDDRKAFESKVQQKDMQASITDIANEIAFKPELAKHLKRELETYAKHNGEQVTYEINGSPATREQVVLQVKKDNPDLVNGDGMSGGGASGSNKGSGALTGGNPWKRGENFNLTEQGRISQSDPQLAQRLMAEA